MDFKLYKGLAWFSSDGKGNWIGNEYQNYQQGMKPVSGKTHTVRILLVKDIVHVYVLYSIITQS